MLKLMETLNESCGDEALEKILLRKSFERCWPELEEGLKKIEIQIESELLPLDEEEQKEASMENIQNAMEELVQLSRSISRRIAEPSTLLPPDYLAFALDTVGSLRKFTTRFKGVPGGHPIWGVLQNSLENIENLQMNIESTLAFTESDLADEIRPDVESLESELAVLKKNIDYLRELSSQKRGATAED